MLTMVIVHTKDEASCEAMRHAVEATVASGQDRVRNADPIPTVTVVTPQRDRT